MKNGKYDVPINLDTLLSGDMIFRHSCQINPCQTGIYLVIGDLVGYRGFRWLSGISLVIGDFVWEVHD